MLGLASNEGLGRTWDMADHMVFIVELASDKQKTALKTVLHEAKLLVQRNGGDVLGIDAEVDLPRAQYVCGVAQRVTQDLCADAPCTSFWGYVHTPDERLVRKFNHVLSL